MKISVVMPVYNEKDTIETIIERVRNVAIEKEIIIVDDFSTDGTREILQKYINAEDIKLCFHDKNRGKGASLRTGFSHVKGDIVIVQDADLEYDPTDYFMLIKPILNKKTKVVFGSRFLGQHSCLRFWATAANKFLAFLVNILLNCYISDMETCYKAIDVSVLKELNLKSSDFNIEPEITIKILKKGYRIYEVPISYDAREYREGKKINWWDGIKAIGAIFWFRFFD